LHYKIRFKDNYKYGTAYEYAKDGRIIAIEEYRYNNLVSRTAVNRYDKNGNKTGKWIDVFDNGKIKSEINYVGGMPNGTYKEFSPSGKIIKLEKFENGKIITKVDDPIKYDTLTAKKLRIVKDFYDNGKLKAVFTYKDSTLYGLQIFYNQNGEISKAEIYNELGQKTAVGIVDTANNKQGEWTFFDDNGNIVSKGNFVNDKKEGKWTYFYPDGKIMQTGEYIEGKPDGKWLWYYQTGQLLREENYEYGLKYGAMYELDIQGDTIVKGYFQEDYEFGKWFFKIGDEYSEGEFYYGKKTGEWISYYYPAMKIKCKCKYINGMLTGKYKSWYPNKRLKEFGQYSNGQKQGVWIYYRPDGSVDYTAEYISGKIVKVNDMPLK
jgi:antitoxin component YwqK of YwqJK toxin-antitoxin module